MFDNETEVRAYLVDLCKDPANTLIDLTEFGLTETDLSYVAEGLVKRPRDGEFPTRGLHLLDIASSHIGEEGFLAFMQRLERGEEVLGRRVTANLHRTVIHVAFLINQEYAEELVTTCPMLFANRLNVIAL